MQLVQALFGPRIYLAGWPARDLQHRPRPCLMLKTGAAEPIVFLHVSTIDTTAKQASSPSAASTPERASTRLQTHHEGLMMCISWSYRPHTAALRDCTDTCTCLVHSSRRAPLHQKTLASQDSMHMLGSLEPFDLHSSVCRSARLKIKYVSPATISCCFML